MQREKRYIVLKCSDVEAAASHGFLNHYQMDSLVECVVSGRATIQTRALRHYEKA